MIRGWRLNGSIVQSSVYRDSSAPFGMSERSSVRMGTQVFLAVSSHLPTSIWLSAIEHRMISLQHGGSSPWCQRNTRNCLSIAPTMPHPTSAAAGGVRQTGRVYSSTPNQALCPSAGMPERLQRELTMCTSRNSYGESSSPCSSVCSKQGKPSHHGSSAAPLRFFVFEPGLLCGDGLGRASTSPVMAASLPSQGCPRAVTQTKSFRDMSRDATFA